MKLLKKQLCFHIQTSGKMDLKARKTFEFNKRVRDLVSKDRTNLREKCDKFDKQCAQSLAAIQQMQEQVRFSMRCLAKDKIEIKQENARRRHSEATQHSSSSQNTDGSQSNVNKNKNELETLNNKEFLQKHRGSDGVIRSNNLDIPRVSNALRRASTPVGLFQPTSPKNIRNIGNTISASDTRALNPSSLPEDLYSWSNKRKVSKPSEKNNKLSINDFPVPPRSPVNLHRKLPEVNTSTLRVRKFSEVSRPNVDLSPNHLTIENRRPRSLSVANVTVAQTTKGTTSPSRKLSGAGPKSKLTRQRSSSLPDLLSPPSNSQKNRGPILSSSSSNQLDDVFGDDVDVKDPDSPLARSFEELRNCRYLRTSDSSV